MFLRTCFSRGVLCSVLTKRKSSLHVSSIVARFSVKKNAATSCITSKRFFRTSCCCRGPWSKSEEKYAQNKQEQSSSTVQEDVESSRNLDVVEVTFVKEDGERIEAKGEVGDSLLDVVIDKNLPFDGYGACEGTLACSTCHVILKREDFDRLEPPSDEELDMLDLAYGLCDTSRLGCQIILSKDSKGLEVKVPEGVSDARLY